MKIAWKIKMTNSRRASRGPTVEKHWSISLKIYFYFPTSPLCYSSGRLQRGFLSKSLLTSLDFLILVT